MRYKMDIKGAMQILSLTTLGIENEKQVKDNYRALMRKYHPDLNNGATEEIAKYINEAYSICMDAIWKMKEMERHNRVAISSGRPMPYNTMGNRKKNILIISLQELLSIYDGNEVEVQGTQDAVKLSKDNIRYEDVYVSIVATIYQINTSKDYSGIVKFDDNNNYEVFYDMQVDSLNNKEKIDIKILDKNVYLDMEVNKLRVKFTFGRVNVGVVITKRKR